MQISGQAGAVWGVQSLNGVIPVPTAVDGVEINGQAA